jgi:intracellular sulfur oxidation DsrE/DsrF family protein
MNHQIESFQLHAYLDGELSQAECQEVERALKFDESLRQQLTEFKKLKQQIKKTYSQFDVPEKPVQNEASRTWFGYKSVVASLLFGFVVGLGSIHLVGSESTNTTPIYQADSSNYLIHLDSDEKDKQLQVIAEITELLESVDRSVQIDLISNDKGVELFNVNNPNHLELQKLLGQYDNLALFACKRALDRASEKGQKLILMPEVNQEKPAIDTVVERLKSGWGYIKI